MNSFSNTSHNTIYETGDYIEFKYFNSATLTGGILKGKITNCSNPDLLEVNPIPDQLPDREYNYLNIIWISPSSITKHYPRSTIKHLSVRLILKDLWKLFIFREVKTIKAKDPYLVTYQYVNNSGFVRTEKYRNLSEAQRKVPYENNRNIEVHYRDYFGFSTDQTIRNNDIYYNQEIFFSKKCYGELNLDGKTITGEFSSRRGFKTVPPRAKQYICGLVEHGEKGLFYRKWFICSKEFLTLWTMICEPDHFILKQKKDGKYVTKTLSDILKDLDGIHYDVTNSDILLVDKQNQFRIYNIENQIIYIPDIYQKVVQAMFNPRGLSESDGLHDYSEKIKRDLMWMK